MLAAPPLDQWHREAAGGIPSELWLCNPGQDLTTKKICKFSGKIGMQAFVEELAGAVETLLAEGNVDWRRFSPSPFRTSRDLGLPEGSNERKMRHPTPR